MSVRGGRWLLAFIAGWALWQGASQAIALPQVARRVLPNGLVLVAAEDHTLPFVTMRFVADAGARRDPREYAGLANVTAEGVLLGTAARSARQINEQLDYWGGTLESSCGFDYASVNVKVLKSNWAQAAALFLELLMQPTFPEEEIRRHIRSVQSALAEEEDQPGIVAQKAFQQALFHYSPYGHPVEGTPESLQKISAEQVRRFHGSYYRPNTGILLVVGDVTAAEIEEFLVAPLSRWDKGKAAENAPEQVFVRKPQNVKIDRPLTQANIILGHAGIARSNPDFPALVVLNQILGSGDFTSRLLRRIRVEKGLAYSVSSYFEPRRYAGPFQIVLQTKNSSARQAIEIARQEMRRLQQEPVSEQELSTAKNYLIGSFPMRYDSQGELARLLGHIEYYRLGLEYFTSYPESIRRIAIADVQAVARKYLQPDKTIVAIVGDLKAAGMQ